MEGDSTCDRNCAGFNSQSQSELMVKARRFLVTMTAFTSLTLLTGYSFKKQFGIAQFTQGHCLKNLLHMWIFVYGKKMINRRLGKAGNIHTYAYYKMKVNEPQPKTIIWMNLRKS